MTQGGIGVAEHNFNAPFTRRMKRTHTILLPEMLEYHSPFLKAAFEGSGYRFEIMDTKTGLKNRALKYVSGDCCYPGILIVGQMLEILEENRFPADQIAFMEPQAGGACRAGNYYHTMIRTLKKCGHEQIPVISLNFKGQEKHPGFRITPRLLFSAIAAVCYGDLVMMLYHQVKPYEKNVGMTDEVKERMEQELMGQIQSHRGISRRQRRENYRKILDAFAAVPVTDEPKKKVGVTGEIYIKFSNLGNHHLEKFLEKQNCQCVMGGFINYAIYVMDSELTNYKLQSGFPGGVRVYEGIIGYLERLQRELYAEVEKYGRFSCDLPFSALKERAKDLIGYECITGDGWLIAAEAVQAIEKGCKHMLIVHPFGCLVSHVCERGILKKMRQKFPGVNIQSIEYDYDSSDALRESRIMLGLSDWR